MQGDAPRIEDHFLGEISAADDEVMLAQVDG
jgi:hypothetical protein